ncbi:MAG TPA: alpha/beta hydrolase [Nocardioidaceae bacterium]|nr:alpha/beta hydrolase [Nocardioidaceae bacterium]
MATLVSERIGQFFIGEDRVEYTEYGAGDRWLVLVHGQLMPRRMHQPLARALAGEGFHVVTVDLLGHGRSDRPADPMQYSMTAFGEQVIELLDHLGAEQAVIGGTSLGANVSLEVADLAPERVRGLLLEMPVLDNGLEVGLITFGPLMFAARFVPASVTALRVATAMVPRGLVPFWAGIVLDTLNQRPAPMAATIHGIFFGRIAPSSRRRRLIQAPALVVGHPRDPVHPFADAQLVAEEMPHARFVQARGILEWRSRPDRLNAEAIGFLTECWSAPSRRRTRVRPT